jgi:hypothetical protein
MIDLIDGEPVYAEHMKREKDDFYATPSEATRAFLYAEMSKLCQFPLIWECAAGEGHMTREMRCMGLRTHQSDLVDRGCGSEIRSFYDFSESDAPSKAIMTNPPFSECGWGNGKARWLYHALDALKVDYMALLLPLGFAGAAGLGPFWDAHAPARVYLMRWRIDFTGQGAPPMLNAWYVWDGWTHPKDTRFLMLDRRDARQGDLF